VVSSRRREVEVRVFFSEISTVDGKHDVLDFWGVDEVFVFEEGDELFLGGGGGVVGEV